jgi:hypothetical protein
MTARRRRPPVPLAPVRETVHRPRRIYSGNGQTAHLECWEAETVDGVWLFEREDSPGTPWLVYHQPSVADGTWTGPVTHMSSLRACRAAATAGTLAQELTFRLKEAERERKHPSGIRWQATFAPDGTPDGGRILRAG